jgi:hypothetical protein
MDAHDYNALVDAHEKVLSQRDELREELGYVMDDLQDIVKQLKEFNRTLYVDNQVELEEIITSLEEILMP